MSEIERILERYPAAGRDSLIPILQEVQEAVGYLSEKAVTAIGGHLGIPAAKIYGVATFYNQFRFQPLGRFHFMVCRGTACHVKGSAKVLAALVRALGVKPGQTSRDGLFSLEEVACIGACGLAPVISVNGAFHAKQTPESVVDLVESCRREEEKVANP